MRGQDDGPAGTRGRGVIEWDAAGLAVLRGTATATAVVWLATGRSLRMVAPVELDEGRVLPLDLAARWVLVPSTSGRAMLVRGRGMRIRMAQAARRVARKARGV